MGIVRQLQLWLGGKGPHLVVADFVPVDHPLRSASPTPALGAARPYSLDHHEPQASACADDLMQQVLDLL